MKLYCVAAFLGCISPGVFAAAEAPGVIFALGAAEDVYEARLGVQVPWHSDWQLRHADHFSTIFEASVGYWRGDKSNRVQRAVTDLGLMPVLRYHPAGAQRGLFFEAGLGAHLLSRTRLDDAHRYGTAFQFGEVAGIGTYFGGGKGELALRVHHISNGSIKQPNDGETFFEARVSWPF